MAPESTVEERLSSIEKRIAVPRKDVWDIFNILASLLIPATIALAGHWYAEASAKAQTESAAKAADASRAVQAADAKVHQAALVGTFMEPLLSADPAKKRLAIRAVLIALPDDGPSLVKELSVSDTSVAVQRFAAAELSDRRADLAEALFDASPAVRRPAGDEILRGWRADAQMVADLIAAARRHPRDANGIYNTVSVLSQMDLPAVATHRAEVIPFLRDAAANGPSTAALADPLRNRL
ncbi:MAG TPA: hypothetical protein VFE05_14795 [Longimicrobiaceae bacterium]|jgi:hypothetical protein|nr:hypothetical protein [Longimicrobiaceae bacterium]